MNKIISAGPVPMAMRAPITVSEVIALMGTINSLMDALRELEHLVRLLEPLENAGSLNVPGLATLNSARAAIAKATAERAK